MLLIPKYSSEKFSLLIACCSIIISFPVNELPIIQVVKSSPFWYLHFALVPTGYVKGRTNSISLFKDPPINLNSPFVSHELPSIFSKEIIFNVEPTS